MNCFCWICSSPTDEMVVLEYFDRSTKTLHDATALLCKSCRMHEVEFSEEYRIEYMKKLSDRDKQYRLKENNEFERITS